jgi:hypothetical protein
VRGLTCGEAAAVDVVAPPMVVSSLINRRLGCLLSIISLVLPPPPLTLPTIVRFGVEGF